jgi:hypothetical protein
VTHRQARKKLGSRTTRRSGTKTQALPVQSKPSGKGALVKFRNPRKRAKYPTLAHRVHVLVTTGVRV